MNWVLVGRDGILWAEGVVLFFWVLGVVEAWLGEIFRLEGRFRPNYDGTRVVDFHRVGEGIFRNNLQAKASAVVEGSFAPDLCRHAWGNSVRK